MEPASINIIGRYDSDINQLVTNAQIIKKNADTLSNKDDLKKLNPKIKQINKEILQIQNAVDKEHHLTSQQRTELKSRLSFIQNNLPKLDYLKQLGKKLPSKVSKTIAPEPVLKPQVPIAITPDLSKNTLMERFPLDLRKNILPFALVSDPATFIEKFKFAIPPNLINREDAKRALQIIQGTNPELHKEVLEKIEEDHPPEVILHEFFVERFETLITSNKLDLIKAILDNERPIFSLENVQKLIDVPTYRSDIENFQQLWDHYFNPEILASNRSRIPLTGTFTYAVFSQNHHPVVTRFCIGKLVRFGQELKEFHNNRFFDRLLDLKRSNQEIIHDVHEYLDGLIYGAHVRGDIGSLMVNDNLRIQLAFARIGHSVSAIDELIIKINDKRVNEHEKKSLMEKLGKENSNLQEYLGHNWARLGEMSKTDRELEKHFALLEAELFNLGHRITHKG